MSDAFVGACLTCMLQQLVLADTWLHSSRIRRTAGVCILGVESRPLGFVGVLTSPTSAARNRNLDVLQGMRFSWGAIVFLGGTKDQSDFLGYKMFFGTQKKVLDIFEKRQGWGSTVGDPKSSRKSSREQQHTKQEKQHKEAEAATSTEKAKIQQHKQTEQQKQQKAQTTESTNNRKIITNNRNRTSRSKLHKQQHKQQHEKSTKRISKSSKKSSKSCTNSTNSNENSKRSNRDTRAQKAGPKRSLCVLTVVC